MADKNQNGTGSAGSAVKDKLGGDVEKLMSAVVGKIGSSAERRMTGLTDKLTDLSSGGGGNNGGGEAKKAAGAKAGEKLAEGASPVKAALSAGATGIKEKVSGMFGSKGGGGKDGKKLKVTNIIEQIDIGAPIEVVYNQWTQFQDFAGFMKKVENVDQPEDTEVTFKAQVLWSHREWKAEIIDQVPDERIVWRSSGQKGKVDGAVTFHELAPELTRVLVVLEYHPQGLFERTGNMWRAQGRRVRLELKHFRRHVMTEALLHPDEVEGWRGEIHDSEVQVSDEDARERDEQDDQAEDQADEQAEDEDYDEDDLEDEDEDEDEEYEDEDEDDLGDEDEDEDEDDLEAEDEDDLEDEDEDEGEDEDEDEAPAARRKARGGRR
ncbi:MAG TPA: SRPBCC family protein [Jatrophihabitans sp.]